MQMKLGQMRIDAHHHLWQYTPDEFAWIESGSQIAQDFDMSRLLETLKHAGVDAAVAVQARQTEDETRMLLEAARAADAIVGVVGWIDLRAPDIDARLDAGASPYLVGYRHVVQDEADAEFLLGAAFLNGVRAVVGRGLTYDLLVGPHQLGSVPEFLKRAGPGRFVLDHAAKPDIRHGRLEPWTRQMAAIAAFPNLDCKISGLVTEADHAAWTPQQIEPYLQALLTLFGPDRLIWGSDWPVCLLAAEYADILDLAERFIDRHCPAARSAIFSGNAVRAYALEANLAAMRAGEQIQ